MPIEYVDVEFDAAVDPECLDDLQGAIGRQTAFDEVIIRRNRPAHGLLTNCVQLIDHRGAPIGVPAIIQNSNLAYCAQHYFEFSN
ncbi:MAG: hypothetical protein ABWY49_07120 [Rhizobium sp.]